MKYIRAVPSDAMVAQERPHSCGAACVRQLLREAGLQVDEPTILERMGCDGQSDITIDEVIGALNTLVPGAGYVGGTPRSLSLDPFASVVPFIALVGTPSRHWIIVDEVGAEEVKVRDPAIGDADGRGRECVVARGEFEAAWAKAWWGAIWRQK